MPERTERDRGADLRWLLVVGAVYLLLRYRVDPSLSYAGTPMTAVPTYSPDPLFLREHLTTIGGPVRGLGAWLCGWFYSPAPGALVLTLTAAAGALFADRAATALAGRRLPGLRYALVLLWVGLDGHYLNCLPWQLGWVISLAAADAYVRWPETRPGSRLVVAVVGLTVLYYLAGGAFLVAVPLVAAAGLRPTGAPLAGLVALFWAVALPWVSTRAGFDRPLRLAYQDWLVRPWSDDPTGSISLALSAVVPAFALLLAAGSMQARQAAAKPPAKPWLSWLGLALVLGALLPLSSAPDARSRLQLFAAAQQRDWPEVLHVADRLSPSAVGYLEGYQILLALGHEGRLGEALFRYPVQPFTYLRTADRRLTEVDVSQLRAHAGVQLCDLDLELGLVNTAEHDTHETLETKGAYPTLLLRMARVEVVKGRPDAARVFLRLATALPASRVEAARLLTKLAVDPTLADDALVQLARARRTTTDIIGNSSVTQQFENLVSDHPDNRLGVEYLFGWYLLSHQLSKLTAALPSLPAWGRVQLPRHYAEAALVQEVLTGEPVELGPWTIPDDVRQRFERFRAALGLDADDLRVVLDRPDLLPYRASALVGGQWADTYYHYRLFGTSGAPR